MHNVKKPEIQFLIFFNDHVILAFNEIVVVVVRFVGIELNEKGKKHVDGGSGPLYSLSCFWRDL